MPVIGHAFVGIVTAHEFEPGGRRHRQVLRPLARVLWMPVLVGLAYLPDVATQFGLWVGYESAKLAGHSIVLGLMAGLVIGIVWARLSGGSTRLLCALAVGSILFHDLLDLLQTTDREPLWPFFRATVGLGWPFFPSRLSGDLLFIGLPWAIYEGRRSLRKRRQTTTMLSFRSVWIARALVLLVFMSAVALQLTRRERRRQIALADHLLRTAQYAQALEAADAADRWPLSTGFGRFDLIRGEAYEGLGELARAETFYLRAYRTEPDNFWIVADLASFYASHGTAAERHERSAAYVEELRRRFSGHRSFRAVMSRLDRAITTSS